ncbi:MAG: FeoB-associated Cys-rich membrane protein [Ruminococcus sp.]|nr:FeoB-associated Cys-rich membrane protein [Ruminococcus sp.]
MNIYDVIILLLIAAGFFLAVRSIIKQKIKGSNCSNCSACSYSSKCHKTE